MRNALAYVPKSQETVVAAAIHQAFIQPDRETAGQVWRHVADQLRPGSRKAEHDVLAYNDLRRASSNQATFDESAGAAE
jgi:hypothetical protein